MNEQDTGQTTEQGVWEDDDRLGEVGILNVGAGHNKIKFDPSDPEGMKGAAEVVKDMLKLGYAILIELPDGTTTRVKGFREDTYEYIIERQVEEQKHEAKPKGRRGRGRGRKRVSIPAAGAKGTAVARTAGG